MKENQIELTLDEEIEMAAERHAQLLERKKEELAEQRNAALAPVLAAIKAHGFTARELGLECSASAAKGEPAAEKAKRPPVPAKYRNPITGGEWTGRGKMPTWLAAHVQSGYDKDDFLIAKAAPADTDQAAESDANQPSPGQSPAEASPAA